jgi:N-acetyl-anhydromuramyl-L-alanine amidase AmpD
MIDLLNIPFIEAKWKTVLPIGRGVGVRPIRWIVMHSMEAPEKGGVARSVANYFAGGSGGRPASAHYCVDDREVIQCVQCKDIAYGAPGANRYGIHVELAGYARQSLSDWEDAFSKAMLANAADLVGRLLAVKFNIPQQYILADGLRAGHHGITTHLQCTTAFGGSHTDPGSGFPMSQFIEMVIAASRAHLVAHPPRPDAP